MSDQTEFEQELHQEAADAENCDAVENVWQNQLATFGYVALAVAVAYILVAPVILLQS